MEEEKEIQMLEKKIANMKMKLHKLKNKPKKIVKTNNSNILDKISVLNQDVLSHIHSYLPNRLQKKDKNKNITHNFTLEALLYDKTLDDLYYLYLDYGYKLYMECFNKENNYNPMKKIPLENKHHYMFRLWKNFGLFEKKILEYYYHKKETKTTKLLPKAKSSLSLVEKKNFYMRVVILYNYNHYEVKNIIPNYYFMAKDKMPYRYRDGNNGRYILTYNNIRQNCVDLRYNGRVNGLFKIIRVFHDDLHKNQTEFSTIFKRILDLQHRKDHNKRFPLYINGVRLHKLLIDVEEEEDA